MMVCGELKATPAEVKALRVKAGWRLLFHYYIPVHTVHPQVTDACSVLNKPKKRIQDTIQAEEHYIRCRWKGHREEGVYASCPHSRPKVLVSSTAISSFSYNMVYDGYGGRSRRLKHVCALRNQTWHISSLTDVMWTGFESQDQSVFRSRHVFIIDDNNVQKWYL